MLLNWADTFVDFFTSKIKTIKNRSLYHQQSKKYNLTYRRLALFSQSKIFRWKIWFRCFIEFQFLFFRSNLRISFYMLLSSIKSIYKKSPAVNRISLTLNPHSKPLLCNQTKIRLRFKLLLNRLQLIDDMPMSSH